MSVFYKWGAGIDPDHVRIERAYDEFLVRPDGSEIIDAASGALVVNLGHSLPNVSSIMAEQADTLSYVSTSHFSNDPVERLADRLREFVPSPLTSTFLVNSGSEANETAIKLARAYHLATGNAQKSTVISRYQSYHGATVGALSAGGSQHRKLPFEPLLHDWPKIEPAYPYRWPHDGSPEEQAVAAAGELERVIKREGPETVAAFIAEPVSGSSIPAARPHPAYYREVRRLCDRYDVLFIADEVMTGFGRTGERFAVEHFDVVPDILTVGKGLSSGFTPIGAAIVHERIADVFNASGEHSFTHGHTFSANPLSAAIADEVVQQYSDELLADVSRLGKLLTDWLRPLEGHPNVGEIRGIGLMVGVEFVASPETKEPFSPELNVSKRIFEACLGEGVYIYPGGYSVDGQEGDHVLLGPPFTTSDESIERIATVFRRVAESVLADVT